MTFGYGFEMGSREVISVEGIRKIALELLKAVTNGRKLAQPEVWFPLQICSELGLILLGANKSD